MRKNKSIPNLTIFTHTHTHTCTHTPKIKKKKLKMAYRPKCKTIKALEDDIAGKGRLSKIYK